MPNNATNQPVMTTAMQEAMRAIRSQEIQHLQPTEMQPTAPRALPPIHNIGRDGVNHLNIARHQGDRSQLSYTLSFSNRVPFELEGFSRPINSLGSLYVFLRHGGKYPESLDLDVSNAYKNFQRRHNNEAPVPNMYGLLAHAIYTKFKTVPGFADLIVATGTMPFDYYIPGSAGGEHGRQEPRRFGDSAIIAHIYSEVRNALRDDRPFNLFNYLDEPTRLSFDIHHQDVKVTAAIRRDYAAAALEALIADLDTGVSMYLAQRASQAAKDAARSKAQPKPGAQSRRPTPATAVAQRLNPMGYTFADIMGGKAKREQQEREEQQRAAQTMQVAEDADAALDERFALPAGAGPEYIAPVAAAPATAPVVSAEAAASIVSQTVVSTATPAEAKPAAAPASEPAEDRVQEGEALNPVLSPELAKALAAVPSDSKQTA